MKIVIKKGQGFLLQTIFSLLLIVFFQRCINECDTANSSVLLIGLDSAGKPLKRKFVHLNGEGKQIRGVTVSDSIFVPLNLSNTDSAETTVILHFLRGKTLTKDDTIYRKDTITFTYKVQPFNRGPECGMDVKIDALEVKPLSSTFTNVSIINKELNSNYGFNVKVTL